MTYKMEKWAIFMLAITVIVTISGSFAVSSNTSSSTKPTSTSVEAEVNEHMNSATGTRQHYPTTTQLISVNGSSESLLNAETFINSTDLDDGGLNTTEVGEKLGNDSSNMASASVTTSRPTFSSTISNTKSTSTSVKTEASEHTNSSAEISSTEPTSTSIKAEVSEQTNSSSSSGPYSSTTTELISVNGSSESLLNAETFLNSSDLVDGSSNTTKEDEKFANSWSNMPPVNTSSHFELLPTETTPRLAEADTPEGDRPSTVSSTNNTETIHSSNTVGLENLTTTPGKSSTHSSQTGDNIHLNTTLIVKPLVTTSTTDLTNSSSTEETLPKNPNDPWQNEYGVIIHATVFFTNGITTPPEPYQKNRYNASFWKWKDELNQLTNLGIFQSYQLGEWLSKRYSNLLHNGQFSSQTVRIDSGQSDNVFMSAESLLAGLFPPRGTKIWNPALLWQPIPIHSEPSNQDSTVSMSKVCREYDLNVESTNSMSEWTQEFKKYENTFNFIGNNTGLSFSHDMFNNLLQAYNCYEKLTVEVVQKQRMKILYNRMVKNMLRAGRGNLLNANAHGFIKELKKQRQLNLSLPEWAKKVYPQPLETLAVKYLQFSTYTDPMKKFKAGPILKLLVDNLQKIADNTTDHLAQKLHLYSGNAYGLSTIMNTLGIFNSTVPQPASALLFELRKKNHRRAITVSLKNTTAGPPYLLQITNCETVCDYTKFISIVFKYIPTNWDDECNNISIGGLTFSTLSLIAGLAVIIVLIFLCLLLSINIYKCVLQKKEKISYK